MFKNILISLAIIIIGSFFTNSYKKQSKHLEIQIVDKKKKIFNLKKENILEYQENIYLKSPENIKILANKYLENNYIFFEETNIHYLELNEKK